MPRADCPLLNSTYLAAYEAASISSCLANRASGIKNGSTSAPPEVLPLPLLLLPPFAAEVLDDDEAGEDEEEEEDGEEAREEDRNEGASSCLHLFTRWRTPSLIACPSWVAGESGGGKGVADGRGDKLGLK